MTDAEPPIDRLSPSDNDAREGDALSIEGLAARYGVDNVRAAIMEERQKVYGDPKANHEGIAQMWACMLQPWALRIALMQPIPAFVVASLMSCLKMNRRRLTYHQDNYDDQSNYDAFSRAWQEDHHKNPDRFSEQCVVTSPPHPAATLGLWWEYSDEEGRRKIVRASQTVGTV